MASRADVVAEFSRIRRIAVHLVPADRNAFDRARPRAQFARRTVENVRSGLADEHRQAAVTAIRHRSFFRILLCDDRTKHICKRDTEAFRRRCQTTYKVLQHGRSPNSESRSAVTSFIIPYIMVRVGDLTDVPTPSAVKSKSSAREKACFFTRSPHTIRHSYDFHHLYSFCIFLGEFPWTC